MANVLRPALVTAMLASLAARLVFVLANAGKVPNGAAREAAGQTLGVAVVHSCPTD